MKKVLTLATVCVFAICNNTSAQKYITKEGQIEIFSQTPIFTIEGINKKVASIINFENGEIVATTLVRSFKFHEALVEDHFNENYMESEKFPKASFKGKILNLKDVDLKKDGNFKLTINGELTIHGTVNTIEVPILIKVKDGKVSGAAEFNISLAGYKIKVEERYKDAIKDEIRLNISFDYSPQTN